MSPQKGNIILQKLEKYRVFLAKAQGGGDKEQTF